MHANSEYKELADRYNVIITESTQYVQRYESYNFYIKKGETKWTMQHSTNVTTFETLR